MEYQMRQVYHFKPTDMQIRSVLFEAALRIPDAISYRHEVEGNMVTVFIQTNDTHCRIFGGEAP